MGSGTGRYFGDVKEAFAVGTWRAWWLVATWLAYPVAVQTVLHPARSIQFQNWLQGLAVPHAYELTSRQLVAGELTAVFVLASLSLAMFMATILLYRKARFWFRLWPLVGLVTGVVGNLGWWIATGHFDPVGALAGCTPVWLAGVIFSVCEWKGKEFVFGKGTAAAQES